MAASRPGGLPAHVYDDVLGRKGSVCETVGFADPEVTPRAL